MRSIGFPELLFLLLIGLAVFAVRIVLAARTRGGSMAFRVCQHCNQQIPCIGSFCPFCGQRVI
jgi:hypothetical protein